MMALPGGYLCSTAVSADAGQPLTTCVNPSSDAELVLLKTVRQLLQPSVCMGPVQSNKLRDTVDYLLSQHQVSLIDDEGDEVTLTVLPNIPAGVLKLSMARLCGMNQGSFGLLI